MAVLNELSLSYKTLIPVLDALRSDGPRFSYDLVKCGLLREDQRVEMRRKSSATSVLLARADGGPGYGEKFEHKQPRKCWNCCHDGDANEFCWRKDVNGNRPKRLKRPQLRNGRKIESSNVIDENSFEVDEFLCLMACSRPLNSASDSSFWIFHSR